MKRLAFSLVILTLAFMLAAPAGAEDEGISFDKSFVYYALERPIPFTNRSSNFNLDDFAIADSRVYMRKATDSFSAGFVPLMASHKGATYEIRMAYSKYSVVVIGFDVKGKALQFVDQDKASALVFVEIGVQVFAQAMIKDEGIKGGLSNFKGLAMNAEMGKAEGTLGVRCVGIGGPGATVLVPTALSLDEASVTIVTDAVSSIKGTMLNTGTKINPCILGFQTTANANDVYLAMPQIIKELEAKYELTKSGVEKKGGGSGSS